MIGVGSQVGPYKVLARLNEGGMGTLFRARREGLAGFTRDVAIKVLHRSIAADAEAVHMFLDEARLSARIAHPNVVYVEELGELDGDFYLVMEYIDGATLGSVMDALVGHDRVFAPEVAVAIAMQVADALHAAHESTGSGGKSLGIIHRDVSPPNILLSLGGHVKLIDFGVAKAKDRLATTAAGMRKGKLAYMAPEQARGVALDRRVDVFALGVVLWEMLALDRLFKAQNDLETIQRVIDAKVPSLLGRRSDVGPRLDAVVRRALAPSADERYPTAHALRGALLEAVPSSVGVDASEIGQLVALARRPNTISSRPPPRPEPDGDDATAVGRSRPPPVTDDLADLERAAESARSSSDPLAAPRALGRLALALMSVGELGRAGVVLDEVAELVSRGASAVRSEMSGWRARLDALRTDLGVRREEYEAAVDHLIRGGRHERAAQAGVHLGATYHELGRSDLAETTLLEAVTRSRQIGARSIESQALVRLASAYASMDRYELARRAIDEARSIAAEGRDTRVALDAELCRARLMLIEGQAEEAERLALDVERRAEGVAGTRARCRALARAAWAALMLGAVDRSLGHSMRAVTWLHSQQDSTEGEAELCLVHMRVLEASGRAAEASEVQNAACAWIEAQAERLGPTRWRESYLAIPAHRALRAARTERFGP